MLTSLRKIEQLQSNYSLLLSQSMITVKNKYTHYTIQMHYPHDINNHVPVLKYQKCIIETKYLDVYKGFYFVLVISCKQIEKMKT